MTNIYWPVYLDLENEFNKLMYYIHIDDNQLNVYSTKLGTLILRAATEIESIAKELYKIEGGTKTGNIKFDFDAIEYLEGKWNLSDKMVLVSSHNSYHTHRIIKPFEKNEEKTGKPGVFTFSWNNSYQNLKHNRAESLEFGTIKYLFEIMAALYLLNIYYQETPIKINKEDIVNNVSLSLGSQIFSIKVHMTNLDPFVEEFIKNQDYNECVYILKYNENFTEELNKAFINLNKSIDEKVKAIPYALGVKYDWKEWPQDEFEKRKQDCIKSTKSGFLKKESKLLENLYFEAVINKNQIINWW